MTTSVYLHIPFCEHLCSYCDFTKMFYQEDLAKRYLDALKLDIMKEYKGEIIETFYIGGGTPSALSLHNLAQLFEVISVIRKSKNCEFTFEINPENISYDKLVLLKKHGVNRISIGVESTNSKFLTYLNRHHDFAQVQQVVQMIKELGINNINVDLIYGMKGETIKDLKLDLDNLMSLDIQHISTYSLEIHPHTLLGIKKEIRINDELDSEMYQFICHYLQEKGFIHYEVSNFSIKKAFSKHNLVYWHNLPYYGFGLGASGYVDNVRYTKTKSLQDYFKTPHVIYQEKLTLRDAISYELILGFRLIDGINKKRFYEKYHQELISQYNIAQLIQDGYLIDDGENIKIPENMIYVENSILENFLD